jgi:hypothetical protein
VVPADKPYTVGGNALMYPGDPAGPPQETINCRCRSVTVIPEVEDLSLPGDAEIEAEKERRRKGKGGFVPAKSEDEIIKRFSKFVDDFQMEGLPLDTSNSILKAGEEVLAPRGIRLQRLDFHSGSVGFSDAKPLGAAWEKTRTVTLDIDFLLDPVAKIDELKDISDWNRNLKLEEFTRILNDPTSSVIDIQRANRVIPQLRNATRDLVALDASDPIDAVARHEFYHIVDHQSGATWRDRLSTKTVNALHERGIGADMHRTDWYMISEYAASRPTEMFVELATARDFGINLPSGFYDALNEVLP